MIKVVCFDLDGVLFSEECFRKFKSDLAAMNLKKEHVDSVFHGPVMDEFKRGNIGEEDFWKWVDGSLGLGWSLDAYASLIERCYEVQPKIKVLIESLRSRGLVTACCSNNFRTRIETVDKSTGFLELIDVPVFSYNIGSLKPEKKIFETLIEKVGVPADQIYYSDDNESKLNGARELGIYCEIAGSVDEVVSNIGNIVGLYE